MDEHILKELQALKETLQGVQDHLDRLEREAAGSVPPPPLPKPAPAVGEPARPVVRQGPLSPSQVTESSQPAQRETLETRIGRDWLNRIGIVSLVLGVAFFILYTFQYFGPAMKIAMGLAIAGGLIGSGVWLERRDFLRWYARGRLGGGWALRYFTTYARFTGKLAPPRTR